MADSPDKTWNWTRITLPDALQDQPVAQVLDDRYALQDSLGSGSQGQVLQALDLRNGNMVAIKVMTCNSDAHRARARLEINALRHMSSPFVVGLLDHGEKDQWVYAVMEMVDGDPLPTGPMHWVQYKPLFCNLLRAVQTMHNQGLVHRDLKPDNVLLRDGVPVLLDLGLSRAQTDDPSGRQMEGTPCYASPEQFRGQACTPQSDLYSLGVMLYQALSGDAPHTGSFEEIREARLSQPAPFLHRPQIPERIALICQAMLEPRPALRPPSADLILRLLGEQDNAALASNLSEALPERAHPHDLEQLFHGQKAFLHIPDDAAEALYAVSAGWRDSVQATLLHWLNQGIATYEDGRLSITRATLGSLRHGQDIRGSKDLATLERLLQHTRFLIEFQGKLDEGKEWARQSAELAIELGELDRAREALEWYCAAQLQHSTHLGEKQTLLVLEQGHRGGVHVDDLCWMIQAQQQLMRGEWGRGRASLENVGPVAVDRLEITRRGQMLQSVSRDADALRNALESEELLSWAAESSERSAALWQWQGNLAWQKGSWKRSFDLRFRAYKYRRYLPTQNTSLVAAMRSAIECEDWDFVKYALPTVLQQCQRHRMVGHWIRTLSVQRSMMGRSGRSAGPRPDLLELVEGISPQTALNMATFDAALCWRRGDSALALELARYAHQKSRLGSTPEAGVLPKGLCGLLGDPVDPELLLQEVRDSAHLIPEMAIQTLGFVAAIRGRPSPDLQADLQRFRSVRPIPWSQLRDVCSPADAQFAIETGAFPLPLPEFSSAPIPPLPLYH
ncbi:MAG: hypothetical protein ACI9VR_002754 [Cognaticolwellia sp.]|jgi:hypothetical protein